MGGVFLHKWILYTESLDINLFEINWISRIIESAWPRAFLAITLEPEFSQIGRFHRMLKNLSYFQCFHFRPFPDDPNNLIFC